MMRRRVERLGRAALQVAYWCQGDTTGEPVIFASRYGDMQRAADLLQTLSAGDGLSPASFSVSVHNAIGALYSIARGDTANYLAIAAGDATVSSAFTEAIGHLADGAPAVMVVVYEEPLPGVYQAYAGQVLFPRAWACRLVPVTQQGISLEWSENPASEAAEATDLAILKFVTSSAQAELRVGRCLWTRHA